MRKYQPRSRDGGASDGRTNNQHYQRWVDMIKRCEDTTCQPYPQYGGRGIKLHEDFKDFWVFTQYIESLPGYSTDKTLDRIDNDGNYTYGNLRWATATEQAMNRRVRRDNPLKITGFYYKKQGQIYLAVINRYGYRLNFANKCPLIVKQKLDLWKQFANDRDTWVKYCTEISKVA